MERNKLMRRSAPTSVASGPAGGAATHSSSYLLGDEAKAETDAAAGSWQLAAARGDPVGHTREGGQRQTCINIEGRGG